MRRYTIHIGAKAFDVSLIERTQSEVHFLCNGERHVVTVSPTLTAYENNPSATIQAPTVVRSPATKTVAAAGDIVSPMPGIVVQLPVAVGATIKAGQTVAVIEAMKMENNISSPIAGTVAAVEVAVGKEVGGGQVLIRIKP